MHYFTSIGQTIYEYICRFTDELVMDIGGQEMNDDTIKLLRECEAGIKMGIESLDEVIESAKDERLKNILIEGKDQHLELEGETRELLRRYNDEGKEPAAMAKMMAKMKSNFKMMAGDADANIADLITDGCDMGIKNLNRYINQYPAADTEVKKLVGKVILAEESLERSIRPYL